jgi:hypothetical protein
MLKLTEGITAENRLRGDMQKIGTEYEFMPVQEFLSSKISRLLIG